MKIYFAQQRNPSKKDVALYDSIDDLISRWGTKTIDLNDADFIIGDTTKLDAKRAYDLGKAAGNNKRNVCFYRELKSNNSANVLDEELNLVKYQNKQETLDQINSEISNYVRALMKSVHRGIIDYLTK